MDDEGMDGELTRKRAGVEFHGWARMGLELSNNKKDTGSPPLTILKVSPPKLGQEIPSRVIGEITIDLQKCGEAIRNEWDGVGEFDNLFLVAVDDEDVTFPCGGEGCMVLE